MTFAQFLLRDQPAAPVRVSDSPARPFGQYGTGLERVDGTPKLAAATFVAGLSAGAAGPRSAELWVRLRLGAGPRRVTIEELRDAAWRTVATRPAGGGPAVRTVTMDGRDASTRRVARRPGARFRLAVDGPDGSRTRGLDVAVAASPPSALRP